MLQQTRVDTALPYYLRFISRFPNLESLASASREDVLKVWEGLGYYRRVGFLQAAARWLLAREGWPKTSRELREVPGVGPYTAGALASIAFGERAPVLDGNVKRVWARVFGRSDVFSAEALSSLWELSAKAVLHGPPSEVNQALMELGAGCCTPRVPRCHACPLGPWCVSLADGRAAERPGKRRREPVPLYHVAVGFLWNDGLFLVQRRPEGALLGGLWELPGGKLEPGETAEEALRREFAEELGVGVRIRSRLPEVRHAYSHFKVILHPFHCTADRLPAHPPSDLPRRWVGPGDLGSLPFPSATLKVFGLAFDGSIGGLQAAESAAAYGRRGR